MRYKKQFENKGFVVIENLLTKNQLKKLRDIINNHFNNVDKRIETLSFLNRSVF